MASDIAKQQRKMSLVFGAEMTLDPLLAKLNQVRDSQPPSQVAMIYDTSACRVIIPVPDQKKAFESQSRQSASPPPPLVAKGRPPTLTSHGLSRSPVHHPARTHGHDREPVQGMPFRVGVYKVCTEMAGARQEARRLLQPLVAHLGRLHQGHASPWLMRDASLLGERTRSEDARCK